MQKRIELITQILDEKKAEDIRVIDMRKEDYFVEFVIIATSLTQRHSLALIDELKTKLKPNGENFLNVEEGEEWSVIDLGDIIIHLLSEDYRKIYNIEELLQNLKTRQN